jgi:hypothetical protein
MMSARRHLAEYPHGYYHRKRHKLSSRYVTTHRTCLIYARGVPDTPDPGLTNFGKTSCTLILVEIRFSRDLGCDKKHAEKTEKYSPLIAALKKYRGRMNFVAIPIGDAGKTLTRTLDHLADAFSTAR